MGRSLLIDNDMFYLLAAAGVLEDVIAAFNVEEKAVHVLPQLKYTAPAHAEGFPQELRAKVCEAAAAYGGHGIKLTPEGAERAAELERQHQKINVGEALLLVYAASLDKDCVLLTTNDRNFLEALAKSGEPETASIEGRVIRLEHILAELNARRGFPFVLERFLPLTMHEQRLRSYLSSQREEDFHEGMVSYVRADARIFGNLLYPFPPGIALDNGNTPTPGNTG